ncbi:MAG: prolyl oligopeptidase family serine peptidase [Gemmatimonadales bacterium]|nr:prolyl oligopeptidase family serine peptidase [Gemmatimonadales bacterium]
MSPSPSSPRGSICLALALTLGLPAGATAQADYNRADLIRIAPSRLYSMAPWAEGFGVLGLSSPTWLDDSTRFQYRILTPRGVEFIIVDPVKGTRRQLFDNGRLAAALSVAADTAFDPGRLPFRAVNLLRGDSAISFRHGVHRYQCELASYRCVKGDTLTTDPPEWAVRSPNGVWAAVSRRGNIWIRRVAAPYDSIQLTTDAIPDFGYGFGAPVRPTPDPDARPPLVIWSPDSKKLAVPRVDERGVGQYAVYSSTGITPRLFQYPTAVPSDSIVPTFEIHLLDVERKTNVTVKGRKLVVDVFGFHGGPDMIQWSPGSDRIYFVDGGRANKGVRLRSADLTGEGRLVLSDSVATFIENASGVATGNWRLVGDREIIWWSERDGWGHLYRYDTNGKLLNQITSGPWLVDRVKYIDTTTRQIFFGALGRDPVNPYYAHMMRVGLDGTGLVDLTPSTGHHVITAIPSGRAFLDVESQPGTPPVATLRSNLDGRKLLELERADPSEMYRLGWTPPTPFTVKARDGVTDLYGLLHLPTKVDVSRKYPVIIRIYPGPQLGTVVHFGFQTAGEPRALAELGFVVVELNALGTPGRSKAFHDAYYGNMGDNGLPDQIAAVKQLAVRHPFMDLSRVGIYGHSGGGFASTGAILRYPDFFKVAVSGSGNHDSRSYKFDWGEKYQGRYTKDASGHDNFESQANYLLAGNLQGRLLLMTGDMDTNVHPSMTFRLVDALIKAGKDFDMLVVPDAEHGLPAYTIKKRWDYFVRWLAGGEPDRNHRMASCDDLVCLY